MKLNFITIMVRDMAKSLIFYGELAGLKIVNHMDMEKGKIVFVANSREETMLELIEFKDQEKVQAKGMVMSYLVKEPLEEIREKAIKLGYLPSAIIEQGQKPKHFTVEDPDGIAVEFMEQ